MDRWRRWQWRVWGASRHRPAAPGPGACSAPLGACFSDRTTRRGTTSPSGHWPPGNTWSIRKKELVGEPIVLVLTLSLMSAGRSICEIWFLQFRVCNTSCIKICFTLQDDAQILLAGNIGIGWQQVKRTRFEALMMWSFKRRFITLFLALIWRAFLYILL